MKDIRTPLTNFAISRHTFFKSRILNICLWGTYPPAKIWTLFPVNNSVQNIGPSLDTSNMSNWIYANIVLNITTFWIFKSQNCTENTWGSDLTHHVNKNVFELSTLIKFDTPEVFLKWVICGIILHVLIDAIKVIQSDWLTLWQQVLKHNAKGILSWFLMVTA